MSLRQTPITALASNYQGLCNATQASGFLPSSIFDQYSSVNQLSFLPGYLSSVWSELYLGSTIYVSTLLSPYAVIVGSDNTVGGIYTLTAGISNSNFGSNAFVGGCNSYGIGANVLAYGTEAQATNTNTVALGRGTQATVPNSIAFGFSSITITGSNQHVEGMSNIADGTASHAEGLSTIVLGDFSHVEGYDTIILNANNSHAEGQSTVISSGTVHHVEGFSTFVYGGIASHAEGANTVANVGVTHAEGQQTIALGSTTHTQGFLTVTSTFISSMLDGTLSTVGASNAHVEGACNLVFMPNNHVEGLSSVNSGWVNSVFGLRNINQAQLNHMEGFSSVLLAPPIYDNFTFLSSFSSILTVRGGNTLLPNITNYSVLNHIEGGAHIISSSYICHVEGQTNRVAATTVHVEGRSNTYSLGFQRVAGDNFNRQCNIASGEYVHIEGLCNSLTSPITIAHMEGVSNSAYIGTGFASNTRAIHFEGFGHYTAQSPGNLSGIHIGGSNPISIPSLTTTDYFASHSHGVNVNVNSATCNTQNAGGELTTTGPNATSGGYCNSAWQCYASLVMGKFNEAGSRYTINGQAKIALGLSNYLFGGVNGISDRASIAIGQYLLGASNVGEYCYGNVAFYYSTPLSRLVRGSAQSMKFVFRSITSTIGTAYTNFTLTSRGNSTAVPSGLSDCNVSSIQYADIAASGLSVWQGGTGPSFPGSNSATYIHAVDVKLTGYQCIRNDSRPGFGFYSGNYSFAIYRDNTNILSTLCIYDMVSQSTTNTPNISVVPISTTIRPYNEVNKLISTSPLGLNLEVWARNTALGIANASKFALYGLKISANNTNRRIITNWTAELDISQVIRPG